MQGSRGRPTIQDGKGSNNHFLDGDHLLIRIGHLDRISMKDSDQDLADFKILDHGEEIGISNKGGINSKDGNSHQIGISQIGISRIGISKDGISNHQIRNYHNCLHHLLSRGKQRKHHKVI